jgi:hypothetical protein
MGQAALVFVLILQGWFVYRLAFGLTSDADISLAVYFVPWFLIAISTMYLALYFFKNEKRTGDFVANRIKRSFRWQKVLPTLTFLVLFFKQYTILNLLYVLSVAVFPIIEASYWLRAKLFKPPGLVVDGDFIYFNEILPLKRDLRTLCALNITGEHNTIELRFEKKSGIAFPASGFAKDDLRVLISIAINKSDFEITIPSGLKYFLGIKEPFIA